MKKNIFFTLLFLISVSLLTSFNCFSLENYGYECSSSLMTLLDRYEFYPVKQEILDNSSADFPFNILINFSADSPETDINEEAVKTLILNFSIQESLLHFNFIKDVLNTIKSSRRSADIIVVFSYGDNKSSRNPFILSGIEIYAENLESSGICAIPINLSGTANTVIPGSGGDCSPSWLIQLITDSFFTNGLFYAIRGGILSSLYRINFLQNDYRTAVFLMHGIPSCGINLYIQEQNTDYQKRIINFFSKLCSSFDPSLTLEWDRHSRPVQFFNRTFFLSEHFTVIIFIISSVFSLFFICQFSFLIKFTKTNIRKSVIRLWPLIPLCVFLTAVAFYLEQSITFIVSKIISIEPVSACFFKLSAGFIIISFVFFAFIRIKGIYSTTVYSYLMTVASIFNIFLFSAIDISLFYPFFIEYLIINLSRPIRKTAFLILFFVVLSIPFCPYIFQLFKYADPFALNRMLYIPFWADIIFAFGFLPFELIWLRILSRFNKKWRLSSRKKQAFMKQNLIAIGSAIGIFVLTLIIIIAFIPEEYKVKRSRPDYNEIHATEAQIKIDYEDVDFYEDTIRKISINLAEKAELVSICVKGKNSIPILYSDEITFSQPQNKTEYFRIPSWPPLNMTFTYIPEDYDDSEIIVTEYTVSPEGNTVLLKQTLEIPHTKTEGSSL